MFLLFRQCVGPIVLAATGLAVGNPSVQAEWMTRSSMLAPAGQAAVVAGGDGRFYFFGGWNSNPPVISNTRKLQIYDPSSDSWSWGTDVPGTSVGDTAIATSSGQIHLCNAYEQRIYPYDPGTDTWLVWHAAPWVTYSSRGVRTAKGRYFVFGGERPDSLTYEYFPDSYAVSDRSGVPYTPDPNNGSIRYPGAYVDAEGIIYVIGGLPNYWTTYGALGDVAAYKPDTDIWFQGYAVMPTPRFAFGYVRGWNGFLYAIGGSDVYFMQDPPFFDVVEYYDPVADAWQVGPPLPEGRRECVAAIDQDGIIYVFGGSGPPDGAYTTTVYAYDTCVGLAGPSPADFDRDGDVDNDDFNHFVICSSGPEVMSIMPGCEHADFDGDDDVDQSDFGVFQTCLSGVDVRADPECAR